MDGVKGKESNAGREGTVRWGDGTGAAKATFLPIELRNRRLS